MPNGCLRNNTINNWQIEVLEPPIGAISSSTYRYRATRIGTANDASNILVCLCPGDQLTDEERIALLESCQWTAISTSGQETREGSSEYCDVNNNPNANANPALCEGIMFTGFPDKINEKPVDEIIIEFTLTEELAVGPINIGLKAGNPGSSGIWEEICGPICDVVPPTRGIPF